MNGPPAPAAPRSVLAAASDPTAPVVASTSAPSATTPAPSPPEEPRADQTPRASRGAAPAAPSPAITTETTAIPQTAGGIRAVIIGINAYAQAPDLHFAEADAGDMAAALAGFGATDDHMRVLTGPAASGPAVRAAIEWLVAEAGPDTLAVVFFAGHIRRLGPGSEGLRLADGSIVPDSELAQWLVGLRARRAWVTIAACFGGGLTEVLAPGRVLTAAAPAGEYAYETTEYDRSFLVQFMIREALIERRTAPTVQDAFAYAAARQRREFQPVQFEMDAPVLDLAQG